MLHLCARRPGRARVRASRCGSSLALGEVYILGRHYLKLLFYASETAFFQGALAHAAYTAAPAVVWPDSPAAETIANADVSTRVPDHASAMTSSRTFKNARILIVDDEPANVDLLRRLLERAGFSADREHERSAGSASICTCKLRPDLILLDLHMPHMDGLEVMDELNQIAEASYLPILMLTGDVTPEARREALSRGAKDFVNKPFHSDEVLLRIRTLLETRFLYLQIQSQNQMLEAKVRERTRELEAAQIEIIERLARAAEFRDDNTGQHTERVGQMAALLARADRAARLAGLADPPRRAAARRRQDRHPRLDPAEAGQADRRRVRARQDAHHDRRAHPVGQPVQPAAARRGDRVQPSRALGRRRLRGHRRRSHPARRAASSRSRTCSTR